MSETTIGEDDTSNLETVTGGAIADAQADVVDQNEADQVRVQVTELRDRMSNDYFEMGRLLYRISSKGLYTQWRMPSGEKYDSFREYVEHEVEFKFRKAKSLMSIWWWFGVELKDPSLPEKIKKIGWTKASALVGVVDAKNAEAWIQKAEGLSAKALEHEAKMALEKAGASRPSRPSSGSASSSSGTSSSGGGGGGGGGGEPGSDPSEDLPNTPLVEDEPRGVDPLTTEEAQDHRMRWTVMLDGSQRKNVEFACDRASEIAEVEADGKGFLLDLICTAFLALHAGAGGNSEDRKVNMRNDILMSVQNSLGLDLVAFEAGTDHAIFGEKTIDRLAAAAGDDDAS